LPSLNRWMGRDPMGQKLKEFVAELAVVNDKTFTLKLKEPYGLVLDSIGKPSSNTPFMMPKAVAETDPFKQIDSQVGSARSSTSRRVQARREARLHQEPEVQAARGAASGLAGGKIAKVDRIECIEMPDPQQQVNALIAGEIDVIEQLPHDLLPILNKERTSSWSTGIRSAAVRHPLQHLQPPFNNRRSARRRCFACARRTT